jgi:hypothetical protein
MVARFAVIAFVVAALAGAAAAEESKKKDDADSKTEAKSVYKLPKVGKPTGRLGGGRRGLGDDVPEVYALVPDHVGYTTSKQPVLYWYMAEGSTGQVKFELTLIDETSVDPLVDKRFPAPEKPGLQRIPLADHGVELRPGEEYQWSIALVTDPSDRSKDVVSSGWIERIPEPEGLADKLAAAGPEGAVSVYGEEGLWYDTLAAACDEVQRKQDEGSRQQLAGLLTEVGLPGEAAKP